jgi:RNA-binding protein Musashi
LVIVFVMPPDISTLHSVLVNNLPSSIVKEDLYDHFSKYGKVADVYIPRDPNSHAPKAFGFVRYHEQDHAEAALESDGMEMSGSNIGVKFAKYGTSECY